MIDESVIRQELEANVPAAFYKPNKAASEADIRRWGGTVGVSRSKGDDPFFVSEAAIRISSGGNRSGKTTKCVLETGSNMTGFRPWYARGDPRATQGLVKPSRLGRVRGLCVMSNFETKIPDIMAEMEKWWPRSWWEISAGSKKSPREIRWFNGSTLRLLSHKVNDRADVEGIEADFIWYDEPPPDWMWAGLNRGIVSTGGKVWVGSTLLDKSGWFWDSIIAPAEIPVEQGGLGNVDVFWHSIWDNCAENGGMPTQYWYSVRDWLKAIEFNKGMDERLAREHGHPIHVAGLVLSGFDRSTHIIDPFELPSDAHVYSAIDPGGAKPMAAAWVAIVRGDGDEPEFHIFDESYDVRSRNDLELFAEDFKARERGLGPVFHPSESIYTIIDPFANQPQKADVLGRTMTGILYEDYGIHTRYADKQNKRARLASLNQRFTLGQVRVWNNCSRFIMETGKWSWDDSSPKLTSGDDDVCDCVSYIESFDPIRASIGMDGQDNPDIYFPDDYYKNRKRPKETEWVRRRRLEHTRRLDSRRKMEEKMRDEEAG